MRPRIRDRGSGTGYAVCGARQSCRSRPSTRRAVARKWGTGAIVPGVRAKSAPERLVLAVRMRLEAKRAAVPQVTTSRGSKTYVRRVESERIVTSCPVPRVLRSRDWAGSASSKGGPSPLCVSRQQPVPGCHAPAPVSPCAMNGQRHRCRAGLRPTWGAVSDSSSGGAARARRCPCI